MTTTLTDAPEVQFEALLRTNWNDANTYSVTPALTTGWYDHGTLYPQGAVGQGDEAPGRGALGYDGFMGDGTGPFSIRGGQVLVTFFAHRKMTGITENPKELVWVFAREAMRIVHANVNSVADFFAIGSGALSRMTDTEMDPVVFMAQFPILYTRNEQP